VCVTLAASAVGYFAFAASLPAQERVLNVGTGGGTGRLDLWTVGLRMVEAHPFAGVGTGQFPIVSVHYLLRPGLIERGDLILSTPKVAHNTYLNVVAELGIVGGVLFAAILLFCVGCAIKAMKQFHRDGDERMEILSRGLIAGIGGYFVTLIFISDNYSKLLWIVFALGPVMLVIARAAASERATEGASPSDVLPAPHALRASGAGASP
jgi:O-antigen ligase